MEHGIFGGKGKAMTFIKFIFVYLMGVCAGLNIGVALRGGQNDNNAHFSGSHRMGLPKDSFQSTYKDVGGH